MGKPQLKAEVWADLEVHDIDTIRDLLARSTDGYSGTSGRTMIQLQNSKLSRDDLLTWITWKRKRAAFRDDIRFWLTFLAAIAATLFAFAAWRYPLPSH